MSLQEICYVILAIYTTINKLTFGATYYSRTTDVLGCADAGANDRCVFLCDQQDWKRDFVCGNAGICDIKCDQNQCLMHSIITATNSLQLNVLSQGALRCFHQAIFHLPNSGSANFSATVHSVDPFTQMIINAGTNTQNIWIDCTHSGICDNMTVNAQTAEFLLIDIDGSVLRGPVDIHCPLNVASSNYKPYEAPCYINAWNQATLSDVTINTLLGMPHDVYINVDDTSNWNSISLTCTGIDNTASVDETKIFYSKRNVNPCWNTRAPTVSPTNHPVSPPTFTGPLASHSADASRQSTSSTMQFTSNLIKPNISGQSKRKYVLWISIIVVIGVLIVCVVCVFCGVCRTRRGVQKQHEHTHTTSIELKESGTHHTTISALFSSRGGHKLSELWSTQAKVEDEDRSRMVNTMTMASSYGGLVASYGVWSMQALQDNESSVEETSEAITKTTERESSIDEPQPAKQQHIQLYSKRVDIWDELRHGGTRPEHGESNVRKVTSNSNSDEESSVEGMYVNPQNKDTGATNGVW
eukprot:512778_1